MTRGETPTPPVDPVELVLSQRFLPERGGTITWLYEVYRRWPRPVEVITRDYGREAVTDDNLRMTRRDLFLDDWSVWRPHNLRRYARMAAAVARRVGPGRRLRVHCTKAVPELAALLPLRALLGRRLRLVCYAHGEDVTACRSSRELSLLARSAYAAADVVIANSRHTRDALGGWAPAERVRVIHPGVDVAAFADAAAAGRRWRAAERLDDRPLVLTVGRLCARKNQRAVLEALAALADRHPTAVYLVAGDGPDGDALAARARALGVGDRVRLLGEVDEPQKRALLGACDVFAMPSVRVGADLEGFGIVFLEAGACGKPVVGGAVGGQPEAVRDGQTGLVVDGEDAGALAGALDRLLADAALRRRLGEAGRAHAAVLDWDRVVERTLRAVDELAPSR